MIAVDFPKFSDGRGYSIAYNLRKRLGYTGELRAIGDVLRDQLFQMYRCGFDAYATRQDRSIVDALKGLTATPNGRRLVESAIQMFGGAEPGDRRSDPDVVARATHELALTDLTAELLRIKAPITVVYAAPSPERVAIVSRNYASGYRAKPDAKLVRIDGSGHMIMHDQPARFRAALKAFLAG